MASTVTVALVGDPRWTFQAEAANDLHTPYFDRPKIELPFQEGDTLGGLLHRAAADLMPGTPWPEAFFDFYREGTQPRLRRELYLLDDNGRVRSTGEWAQVPMRELLRAADAGALEGDPRRPYLLNHPFEGNGLLADWPTFIELLKLWWMTAVGVATAGGVWQFFKFVGEAMAKRGPESAEVAERHATEWSARGLRPDRLLELLSTRPWHEDDLSGLLGCTAGEAAALLTGLGYATRTDGLWVPADDEGSRLLRGNIDLIAEASMTTKTDAIEEEFRRRLDGLRASGRAQPVDWNRVGRMPQDTSRFLPPGSQDDITPRQEIDMGVDELTAGIGEIGAGAASIARGLWRRAKRAVHVRRRGG